MKILGLETSSAVCSVGLIDDQGAEFEAFRVEARIHSEKLLTMVQEVLKRGVTIMQDISAIVVSTGPGSFTGLRIGLSTAKGLCYALEKPLLVVPTFDGLVAKALETKSASEIIVAVDAKQGQFYTQRYGWNEESPSPLDAVRVAELSEIAELISENPGAHVVTDSHRIAEHVKDRDRIVNIQSLCSGVMVARLGLIKFLAKEFADVASAEPMYLKDFVVRTVPTR